MRKILCLLLAFFCILSNVGIASAKTNSGAVEWTEGVWTYEVNEAAKQSRIIKYDGPGGAVEIPKAPKVNRSCVVTELSWSLFSYGYSSKNEITSVTIPNTVKSFSADMFKEDDSPKIIIAPDHPYLAIIDDVVFEKEGKKLLYYPSANKETTYSIPQGILTIAPYAFKGCKNIETVIIPDSVKEMNYAFKWCQGLKSIIIPCSVSNFESAFERCDNLSEVILEDGISQISKYAFEKCSKLTKIMIPESVTAIGPGAFSGCTGLKTLDIPESVTTIGGEAFCDCGASKIVLPKNVSKLDGNPFAGNQTRYKGEIEISSENEAFEMLDGSIYTKDHKTLIACRPQAGSREFVVSEGTTTIAQSAFYGCESLMSITLPASIESIEDWIRFGDCENATLYVIEGSYAHEFAQKKGYTYAFPGGNNLDWLNS